MGLENLTGKHIRVILTSGKTRVGKFEFLEKDLLYLTLDDGKRELIPQSQIEKIEVLA